MKRLLTCAMLCIASMPAHAISRHQSSQSTCAGLHQVLEREGAAIFRYKGQNASAPGLYDRYVASQQYCQITEITETVYVPASDTASWPILHCVDFEIDNDFDHR